jgi:hypothetical protein
MPIRFAKPKKEARTYTALSVGQRRFAVRFRTSVYLVLAVGLLTISVLPVSAAVQTNIKVPVDIGVFIPCAADGAGEVAS